MGPRIPRRGVEQLPATALGIEMSLGSTRKLVGESSEALAETCQELERQLPREPVLNSDETGWRSMGERHAPVGAGGLHTQFRRTDRKSVV